MKKITNETFILLGVILKANKIMNKKSITFTTKNQNNNKPNTESIAPEKIP